MTSLIVATLAQLSEDELRDMRSKLEAERARVDLELEQVSEALTRQSRRSGARSSQRGGRSTRPGSTQKRILDAVERLGRSVTPSEIIAEMATHGSTPSRGSIHTTIGRLVQNGLLVKPVEDQPYYELASRDGAQPEARTGPTEHEATEPLLTATEPQVADSDS